jgi:hypothetical protein
MVAQRQSATPIKISAVIGEDRRLIVDLPADTPTGPAQIEVLVHPDAQPTPHDDSEALAAWRTEYERLRAKLAAAGALSTTWRAPEGAVELTEAERIRIGTMPPGAPSSEQSIAEDRGEY